MCGRYIGKHYITTKNRQNYGASTFFEIEAKKFLENNIFELLERIIPEKDDSEGAKELRQRKLRALCERTSTVMRYRYGPFSFQKSLILGIFTYPCDAKGAYHFRGPDYNVLLNFPSHITEIQLREEDEEGRIDHNYLEKIKFYLDLMENVFNFFQCEFGWGDNFDYQLKFQKKGSHGQIFGVNYFGKKLVEEIGREKLLSLKDCKIKEMQWGGIILQLAENPFVDISEERRKELKNILYGKTKK